MRAPLLALALCAFLPGCASLAMTPIRALPYAGVRLDADIVLGKEIFKGPATPLGRTLAAIDLPLSFAVDTAFLPLTLPFGAMYLAKRVQK